MLRLKNKINFLEYTVLKLWEEGYGAGNYIENALPDFILQREP